MRTRCLVAVALLFAGTAGAATVERLTLGKLADRSELVFVGTVASQRSVAEHDPVRVWTQTTFEVEESLKGPKATGPIALRQLGGAAEGYGQEVPGYATFAVGERVLVFLERTQTGRLVVTGLAQGKFTLTTDPKTGDVLAERSFAGLNFTSPPPTTLAGMPSNPNRVALRDLAAIVRGRRPTPRPLLIRRTPRKWIPEGGAR